MAELELRETWDSPYFERLSRRIRAGRYSPAGLRQALEARRGPAGPAYDALDTLALGILRPSPDRNSVVLGPEMTAYQPTPLRQVLSLIECAQIGPKDRVFDLGSGLGQVAILVALLSGAQVQGIEIEPAYVESSRRSAARLGLGGIEFVVGDARQAVLDGGSVYFLYSPFRGALLLEVLDRLRIEGSRRSIRVCTLGPCTAELRAAGCRGSRGAGPDDIEVFLT